MTTYLVLGATGATGRLLTQQLLDRGEEVRVIVRSPERLPDALRARPGLSVTAASLLDLDDAALARHIEGCTAVASCLGHTLSVRGVLGPPYRLVTNATRRVCDAIIAAQPSEPVRLVLMNTAGVTNRDLHEQRSRAERTVSALLRVVLPPYSDSDHAAEYLRTRIGRETPAIEWAVVRPDTLIDEETVSAYSLHQSPTRSALFNAGKTSRINVAHFMMALMTRDDAWERWKGQMPVIYNASA